MTTISKQQVQGLSHAARQLIDAAMTSGTGPYFDADDPDHDTAVQEMLALNRAVHESADIGRLTAAAPILSQSYLVEPDSVRPPSVDVSRPPAGHIAVPTGAIEPGATYRTFKFDPDGPTLYGSGMNGVPTALFEALKYRWFYEDELRRRSGSDANADAIGHAATSLELARELGAQRAKELGDAYERTSTGGAIGSRLMDLHNNRVGRLMANDPRFAHLNPFDAAYYALGQGWLATRHFRAGKQ